MKRGTKVSLLVLVVLLIFVAAFALTGYSASKPVQLSMFVVGSGDPKDKAIVEQELNKYLEKKINAKISLNRLDWGEWSKVDMMMNSGEVFDLVFTASWFGYNSNAAKGAFLELDDLLKKYAPKTLKQIDSSYLEAPRLNGKLYALPTEKERAASQGVLLNKKLVDKYKFDLSKIKTLRDLEPLLKAIKENEPAEIAPFLVTGGTGPLAIEMDRYEGLAGKCPGVIYKNATGAIKVMNIWATPELKEDLKLNRSWFLKGYFNPDASTLTNIDTWLRAGRFFAYWQSMKPGKDAEMSSAYGVEMVQVELTQPYQGTRDTCNSMMSVSQTSKNPVAAVKFLELLHTDKYVVNTVVYGVEGKHYVKKSANVVDFPDGVTAQSVGYHLGNWAWQYGNAFLTYLMPNENPKKWELFKEFNAKAKKSPLLGFNFNPDSVNSEIAACNVVVDQYLGQLAVGEVDPETELPKMLKDLDAAGNKTVIAEMQRQVDAFLAAKKK